MMSPKFRAEFDKAIDQLVATVKQAKIDLEGGGPDLGGGQPGPDSAQVLVVSDASVKTVYDPNVARHFRWEVSLVKINGHWLVDNFTPVA